MGDASAFLFGKLPAHGDFVCRGLTQAGQAAWDACASDLLAKLREMHGDSFDAVHEAIAPWRFLLAPGDEEESWCAGAMAPSIDSVGRRFLVVVGVRGLTVERACGLGFAAAEAAERLIYEALRSAMTADALLTAAADVADDLLGASGPAADALGATTAAPGVWWRPGEAARETSGPRPPLALLAAPQARAQWEL